MANADTVCDSKVYGEERIWNLFGDISDLSVENKQIAYGALYNPGEIVCLGIILFACVVGLLGNAVVVFTVIRNRTPYNCFLMGLAIADFTFLLSGSIFFFWPPLVSPVSFDVPFKRCCLLISSLLVAQVASTLFTLTIAVETHFRITSSKWHDVLVSSKSVKFIFALIITIALVSTHWAIPDALETTVTRCVIWPSTPSYDNFPNIINTCPPDIFSTISFIIFHEIPGFYLGLLIFCLYTMIFNEIKTKSYPPPKETVTNLKWRYFTFIALHLLVRVNNLYDTFTRYRTGESYIPSEYVEIVYLVLRVFLMTQAAVNPFIYVLSREDYRPLVRKAFSMQVEGKRE